MTETSTPRSERVARYLRHEMTAAEAIDFEIELLEDEHLFQEVQLQETLTQGLRQSQLALQAQNRSPAGWFLNKAASWVLLAGIATLLALQSVRLHQAQEQLQIYQQPQAQVPVFTIQSVRSLAPETVVHVFEHTGTSRHALIEIDVSALDQQSFKVQLSGSDTTQSWNQLTADERGFLTLLLTLPPQPAEFIVEIQSFDGQPLLLEKLQIQPLSND